jgi:hypothetical protein
MKRISSSLLVAATLGLVASGCYVESGPPPASNASYAVEAPPPAPPAQETETVPPAPGPDFLWIAGAHRWNGRAYEWQRGHYERKPQPHAQYSPGHWEKQSRGHRWIEGRWQ